MGDQRTALPHEQERRKTLMFEPDFSLSHLITQAKCVSSPSSFHTVAEVIYCCWVPTGPVVRRPFSRLPLIFSCKRKCSPTLFRLLSTALTTRDCRSAGVSTDLSRRDVYRAGLFYYYTRKNMHSMQTFSEALLYFAQTLFVSCSALQLLPFLFLFFLLGRGGM